MRKIFIVVESIIFLSLFSFSSIYLLAASQEELLDTIARGNSYTLSLLKSGKGKSLLSLTYFSFPPGNTFTDVNAPTITAEADFSFKDGKLRWDWKPDGTFLSTKDGVTVSRDEMFTRKHTYIVDQEKTIEYIHYKGMSPTWLSQNTYVMLRPPDHTKNWDHSWRKFDPFFFMNIAGTPLAEIIRKHSDGVILRETNLKQANLFILNIHFYPGKDYELELHVTPQSGFLATKWICKYKGKLESIESLTYKKYASDVWFLDSVISEFYDVKTGNMFWRKTVKVEEFQPNCVIEDSIFTIDGLGIPCKLIPIADSRVSPPIRYFYRSLPPPLEKDIDKIVKVAQENAAIHFTAETDTHKLHQEEISKLVKKNEFREMSLAERLILSKLIVIVLLLIGAVICFYLILHFRRRSLGK